MNNALVSNLNVFEEEKVDIKPILRKRQTELLKLIEAVIALNGTKEWQEMDGLLFKGLVESLEKRLNSESNKKELDTAEIYRLQGQLVWAIRFTNLSKLVEAYKLELNNITKKLNENANS